MRLLAYILRWQLSTPILYLAIAFLPYDNFTKTIIANFIGALIFYPIDYFIFKLKK